MCRERETIMRTTLKNMLIIVLLVLSGTMQAAAVEYKNNYRGVHKPDYQVQTVSTAAPSVTFQSTSAYSGQFSNGQQSMLNSDGSIANSPMASAPMSGPRRAPGTPTDEDEEEEEQQPLGDGLIALMLCACAYLIVRATSKEEKIG